MVESAVTMVKGLLSLKILFNSVCECAIYWPINNRMTKQTHPNTMWWIYIHTYYIYNKIYSIYKYNKVYTNIIKIYYSIYKYNKVYTLYYF